jgi:endoribonuclease Dicer
LNRVNTSCNIQGLCKIKIKCNAKKNLAKSGNHLHEKKFFNMTNFPQHDISRVNLLIFDECHHAVKCDAYVGIMKHFKISNQRPRILGLSASIISGKCKPFQLERKLKDLEVTLCSHIETAKDVVEVAKYATNPGEVLVQYSSQPNNSCLFLKGIIDNLMTSISHLPKLKNCIEDCKYIFDIVGTSAASQAAEFIITGTLEILTSNPEYSTFCPLVERKLREFKSECTNSRAVLSSKTDRLMQLLVDAKSKFAAYGDNKLCGIIFVEQKVTAVCLMSLITSHQNSLLSHVKCGYIVGHTGCGSKVSEHGISMNVKKQQEVLRKFRSGEINMLIATSVVEEELDVPKCNLVIRFDLTELLIPFVNHR